MTNKKNTEKKTEKTTKKVTNVSAEKSKKTETAKRKIPKYHFSINLSGNKQSSKDSQKIEKKEKSASPSSTNNKTTANKSAQTDNNFFKKETEAVRVAETAQPKDVKHIKYSEQQSRGNKATLGSVLDAAGQSGSKKLTKLDQIKDSINQMKSDPKSFKELQKFVKPSLLDKPQFSLAKAFTVKHWTNTLMGIMKGIDIFISFVIMPRGEGRNPALQKARSPVLFGLWVFFIFFIIGGFWAGFAPLDKAVNAPGFIVTTSKKQVIQHKEGGIIEKIYVKEGKSVKPGQALVKLETSQIKTQLESLYNQKNETEKILKTAQEQVIALKDLADKGFIAKFKVTEREAQEAQYKSNLSEINAKIANSEEFLDKLVIKSPVNGVVTQLNINTIGGTVGPGQAIMTITPSQEDLVLEAYVQAKDIEPVRLGLKAKVIINAFVSKSTSYMEGVVTYVSPDVVDFVQKGRVTNEDFLLQKGAFYKVRISIDKAQLKKISKLKDYELSPGMDANVQITIGERTLIQYLLDPILMTFWHAFKEK